MKRNFRKPLVVITPKSLLRHKLAVSSVHELAEGQFHAIIDEPTSLDSQRVSRLLFCSGKVYYDLLVEQKRCQVMDTAIVRIEQLYPLPCNKLTDVLKRYPQVKHVAWVQGTAIWALHAGIYRHCYRWGSRYAIWDGVKRALPSVLKDPSAGASGARRAGIISLRSQPSSV